MAQLAIKGHETRGNEVIEILEMLGGKNKQGYNGENNFLWHYINERSEISVFTHVVDLTDNIFFTLKEFLEKFPYKVRDKVIAYYKGILAQFTIQDMRWNYELNKVEYKICSSWLDTSVIQPYKEETIDKANKSVFDANAQCCDIMNDIIKKDMKEIKIDIPAGYEFAGIDDNAQQVVFTKIGYHYPKTYEECYDILGLLKPKNDDSNIFGYSTPLLSKFQKLLVCRDAYWKIAGEQMGLDKSWKPNWKCYESYYCIFCDSGEIVENEETHSNTILAFPTTEMRDAFHKNFKELIEFCKELL